MSFYVTQTKRVLMTDHDQLAIMLLKYATNVHK